jgi:diaminopimelate decarboxylase
LSEHYAATAQAAYASKAFLCTAIAALFAEEGLDLDVVSGGELYVALSAGFPAERIHFHGNNKPERALAEALRAGVGRLVVDNFHELEMLKQLADAMRRPPVAIWLRLAPGVQAHTHAHIQTGQEDTKFGFSIASGDAERAVSVAMAAPQLALLGLHAHIGSQIYEPEALAEAAGRLIGFAAQMRDRHGFTLQELSPGGGWGVPMVDSDPAAPIERYVAHIAGAVTVSCRAAGLALPHLVLEPGRSLVARAGVALYTVGARKEIPGVRTYVAVDGGMADNIRPALYGAQYAAEIVGQHDGRPQEVVTIAGCFCESGDILIRDITLPQPQAGDVLAVPMAGAYTLAMASNYNLTPRPAAVMVRDGMARLIQRRETYADLLSRNSSPASPLWKFHKYQALGNDYVVLEPAKQPGLPSPAQIRRICDRRYGVGADGVLWGPLDAPLGGFGLRLFNPDGGEFEVSGNGVRIFARFLWDHGLTAGRAFVIHTLAGPIAVQVLDDEGARITLAMGRIAFDDEEMQLALDAIAERFDAVGVNIGNPHCVVFLGRETEPSEALARRLGPQIEVHPRFPHRTNVQFVQVVDRHTLRIEIWERGAGYTLASGTSSCAAAGAAIRRGFCESPVTVRSPGGELLVDLDEDWSARLTGPVAFVCRGELAA